MLIAIVNGPDGEQVSEIDDQSIVLGRHGTLRLTDRKVSKQHARLQSDGRDWYLEDMGSKNGTFVNGVRVVRPCRVKEGDRLRLGQTQLVLSRLSQPQQLSAPRMKVASEPSPPHALQAEALPHAPASAPVTPASAPASEAPKTSPATVDSGFLTLSASDLLESPADASSPLALDPPPLDLAEAPPPPIEAHESPSIESADAPNEASSASLEAFTASEQVETPVEESAASAEEVGAIQEEISEDSAPVADSAPVTDRSDSEPRVDIEPFESDAAPTTGIASLAEPISGASDVAPAPIDDEATPFGMDDAPVDAAGVDDEMSTAREPSADDIAPEATAESVSASPAPEAAMSSRVAEAEAEVPPETDEPAGAGAAAAPVVADAGDAGTSAGETPSTSSVDGAERLSPVDDGKPAAASTSAIKAPSGGALSEAAQQNDSAAASEDDESLAAFMNVLPAQQLSMKSLARTPDESILSIHPLTMRDELALRRERLPQEPTSPWRRSIPYAMLSLVLLAVFANLALLVLFRRDAGRDAAALQESLKKQQQLSAELILQEVRAELRAPGDESVQALQALGDSVLAKQEALAEKLQSQLAAQHEAASKQPDVAAQDDQAKRAAEESRAAMMRELSEIKLALADMRKAAVAPPPPSDVTPATPQRNPAPSDEAAAPTAVAAASRTPSAPAVAPPAFVAGRGYQHSFVIDASGALQNAIPDAVAEVRRAMETARTQGNVRILLVYQGRLIELPPAALQSPSRGEPIDRGEGNIAAAVKLALEDRPSNLNLLSDTLGGVDTVADVLRKADMTGTAVNVTQFFSRSQRDQLKSLAREYHGTYGYVAPR